MFQGNLGLVATLLLSLLGHASAAVSNTTVGDRPWLDTSLPTEQRLELLMQQFNTTQIYNYVQGDTVVREVLFHSNSIPNRTNPNLT